MADNPHPLLLTEQEAARRIRTSPRSLQRLRLDGDGPDYVQLTGRRVGYREIDLAAWVERRLVNVAA